MAGFGPTDPAHYNDDYLRERGSNDTDSADGSLTFNFARIHKIATLAAGAHGMAGRLRHGSLLPERSAGEEPSMERIDEAWEIERRESLRKMSSKAIAREPTTAELSEGYDGGGGVRLHPPHLDDSLGNLDECFVPSATTSP